MSRDLPMRDLAGASLLELDCLQQLFGQSDAPEKDSGHYYNRNKTRSEDSERTHGRAMPPGTWPLLSGNEVKDYLS